MFVGSPTESAVKTSYVYIFFFFKAASGQVKVSIAGVGGVSRGGGGSRKTDRRDRVVLFCKRCGKEKPVQDQYHHQSLNLGTLSDIDSFQAMKAAIPTTGDTSLKNKGVLGSSNSTVSMFVRKYVNNPMRQSMLI